jgi:hypothetical protein
MKQFKRSQVSLHLCKQSFENETTLLSIEQAGKYY